MQQGRHASCHAFGHPDRTDNSLLPYGIYAIPEISMVGRNEEELTQADVPYGVGIARGGACHQVGLLLSAEVS